MARVALKKPQHLTDPEIEGMFAWVTEMEGNVPNHFYVELNFPEFFTAKLGATKVLWETGELSMEEIQHVGIVVSQANGCPYCTAAFCTILNHGLGTAEDYVGTLLQSGVAAVEGDRLRALLEYALQVNQAPAEVSDQQVEALRSHGLSDKGIVQLTHVVSDFSSYNTLNLALDTDYDYRDFWRELAGFSVTT
ncbi:carboxymuconolactone decarboxylase family protein [Luminiphilus sp.]|nr:carboxymuconolactone decarboxylase family protein [Luminiphilus sp.]MDB2365021.1 carboxymuconolactone decarboxylase family protein [Luminiphilus sp.]MDC1160586.1 carboxymuconolactone decarboxylase family protein [Luminiphilus sp.]MDC6472200.1 carboxymuconolactone decarboxylase family protein [Luminiphilus sp.]